MVVDNLKKYIDYKGISISEFERNIGMSNNSFRKSLNNNGNIGSDKIENILKTYPDINIQWLLTGKGKMLQSEHENQIPIAHKSNSNSGIPLIPISAMAGSFTGDMQVLYHDCEMYDIPCFRDADFLIPVKGDSMYPTYRSGDIVACRKLIKDNLFFQWSKVYVLDTDQGALIKRIKPGKDEENIMIVSDNESYDPFNLHISHIYNIALVIGLIRIDG